MSDALGLGNLGRVIDSVVKDKGIKREIVVSALEQAILAAAKKRLGTYREIEAQYNEDLGEVELFEFRTVVEDVEDDEIEISLDDAHKLDPDAQMGDEVGMIRRRSRLLPLHSMCPPAPGARPPAPEEPPAPACPWPTGSDEAF